MPEFTVGTLTRIMRECVRDAEVDLSADRIDTSFEELGYDSLAVLEIVARINQELGARLPDEAIETTSTPRQALAVVNDALAERI